MQICFKYMSNLHVLITCENLSAIIRLTVYGPIIPLTLARNIQYALILRLQEIGVRGSINRLDANTSPQIRSQHASNSIQRRQMCRSRVLPNN